MVAGEHAVCVWLQVKEGCQVLDPLSTSESTRIERRAEVDVNARVAPAPNLQGRGRVADGVGIRAELAPPGRSDPADHAAPDKLEQAGRRGVGRVDDHVAERSGAGGRPRPHGHREDGGSDRVGRQVGGQRRSACAAVVQHVHLGGLQVAHDLERAKVLDREGGKGDGGAGGHAVRQGGSHQRAVLGREVVGGRVEVCHATVLIQLNIGRSDDREVQADRE